MDVLGETAPGLTGLQQLKVWLESGRQPAIAETLQFKLVEVGEGRAVFEGVPGLHAYNPIGTVHGGYAAAMLDSACGVAVHSRLSATQAYTTLELKVAYHRAMTKDTGLVRAVGEVVTMGRRAAFAEARVIGVDGRLYASATSSLLVIDR
jgi:uncharacterized protein (TIGR00369 family)